MPRADSDKNTKIECKECGKRINRSNIRRHENLHKFKCTKCAKSFSSVDNLNRHELAKHSPSVEPRPFTCRDCGEGLTFSHIEEMFMEREHGAA